MGNEKEKLLKDLPAKFHEILCPTVGSGDSKCGKGRRCAMSAVVQERETYLNMAAKGQSNDLSIDAVQEAVLADMDDLSSQESDGVDEVESVPGESKDIVSEKIEMCLHAFDSLDLGDVNLEMLKKCVQKQIEASYCVFQSPTDPLKILLNVPDETKLWLDKINFLLGGKVSIRRPYQCEII